MVVSPSPVLVGGAAPERKGLGASTPMIRRAAAATLPPATLKMRL